MAVSDIIPIVKAGKARNLLLGKMNGATGNEVGNRAHSACIFRPELL